MVGSLFSVDVALSQLGQGMEFILCGCTIELTCSVTVGSLSSVDVALSHLGHGREFFLFGCSIVASWSW